MKYTLSSQEYNELFRNARDSFDNEMQKRDLAIENMNKKLDIINITNEFIENKITNFNNAIDYNNKLVTFNNELYGSFNQYGFSVHPKFKNEPIDIFNLKLMSGSTMFKNSLVCKVNDVINEDYVNVIMADNSIDKKIIFNKNNSHEQIKIEYSLKTEYLSNGGALLGLSRFNLIEIDPYIYGAYSLDHIEIFTLNEVSGVISETPIKTTYPVSNMGKTRIILDEKVKFNKVVFYFDLKNIKTQMNNIDVYPFGLKHIHFYEADFLDNSSVVVPIRANDYIEYIYNDIVIYQAGLPLQTTCDYYNIEIYTDYINGTLTGRVYTSSDAQAYRIAKNTKVLYAKIPLIWKNEANSDKQYLSLTGILFNYVVDEDVFI